MKWITMKMFQIYYKKPVFMYDGMKMTTDAREFAKEIDAKFYLTSARNNSGINDLFANIAKEFTGDENVKMKEGNEDDNGNGDTVDDEPKDKFGSMKIIKKQSVDTLAAKKGCCK